MKANFPLGVDGFSLHLCGPGSGHTRTHVTSAPPNGNSYMRFSTGLFFRRPLAACVAIVGLLCGLWVHGQENVDPNNLWYRAFLLVRTSQELEEKGKYLESLNKLNEAQPLYLQLAQSFPDFQPDIVRERRRLIEDKRDELKYKMRNPPPPGQPAAQSAGSSPVGNGARSREVEIAEPDTELALPSWNDDGSSQTLPRLGQGQVKTPSSIVGEVSSSLYDDLKRKDSLISQLMKENLDLRKKVENKEKTEQLLRDRVLSQSREVEKLRQQAQGADGAEKQRLKQMLRESLDQLEKSDSLNRALLAEVDKSRSEMKKLKSRMAELERERDNLLEVVSGEDKGGKALKELMDRNAELTGQLDRAEKLAASLSELNTQKDSDIALLKSEIAKVKMERDNLVADNARHQKNIDQLQKKLQLLSDGLSSEEKQLLANISPVERQENELLRSLVLKQLRRQAQIKEAKKLLLRQLDKVGVRSEALLGIVADIATGPQLTPEEKSLFKEPQFQELVEAASSVAADVSKQKAGPPDQGDSAKKKGEDGSVSATLIAPGNDPNQTGVIKNQKISVELEQVNKSARLDFKEGRYAEAEAGFLRYLHFRPRSISCLCNLGILKIAMKNYSDAENFLEKALALDHTSGLANYLLGRTYFLENRLDEALVKLEQGVKYDPKNAKAQNCLGVVSSKKGLVNRAEQAFDSAVSIDPNYGDAHFNLAVLYATRKQPDPKKSGDHYFKALHLGVPRSARIEEFLKEAQEADVTLGLR